MAQSISVRKEQQTNKHAPLAILLCLLLLFSSFSLSFAVDETNAPLIPYYNSGGQPSQYVIENYGLKLFEGTADSVSQTTYVISSDREDLTTGLLVDNGTLYALLCIPPDTSSSVNVWFKSFGSTVYNFLGNSVTTESFVSSNGNIYQVAKRSIGPNYDSSGLLYEPFTSIEQYVDYLDGVPSGDITNNGNAIIVVNPGNVAYIGYNSATFNFLINLDKPVSNFSSNARYGFASELPNGVLTFTPSSGNALPLRKSVPDLLGRSATWVGSVDTDTIGYFIVYNPVYDLNGNTNKPIRVTVTLGYMNVTQFPLTATDIGGDIVSSGNSDNFYISDGMQGGTDLPAYIYSNTDQNGNITTSSALTVPVTPYNYTEPSAGSSESGLQGFLQQILDLLSAPIKHIQNLYNSAVSFFNYLTSLWGWLPPELITIITSALVVLVVIGVVKFLWK